MINPGSCITRRSKIQIIIEILKVSCETGFSRHDLISTVKVNYQQADYYLDWLERRELLATFIDNNCRKKYRVTLLGKKFLSIIDNINQLLDSSGSSKSHRFL
jgi:predicted transcriptional regulator